jgi:hypothetical protein
VIVVSYQVEKCSVSRLLWVQDGPAPLCDLLRRDAITWHVLSLKMLSHFLRPPITKTTESQQMKCIMSKLRHIFLQNLCYQFFVPIYILPVWNCGVKKHTYFFRPTRTALGFTGCVKLIRIKWRKETTVILSVIEVASKYNTLKICSLFCKEYLI